MRLPRPRLRLRWSWAPLLMAALLVPGGAAAQATRPTESGAWFGLTLPPGLGDPHRPIVPMAPGFSPEPAVVPRGEEVNVSLEAGGIWRDLETIVGFSRQSRADGDRLWGRITGRPAGMRTIEWAAERMRQIGLQNVEVQRFQATADMWWPVSWEVRLVGDPAYGPGSADVVLESAFPTSGSELAEAVTAPLVLVGPVGQTDAAVDVAGKVAVQLLDGQSSAYAQRRATVESARALMERGAVAVLNVVPQPGNMHVRDFSNCGVCFNLGGADGAFLQSVLENARRNNLPEPRVRLTLQTETLTNLTGANAVGVIPGDIEDILIVNAHADGWFDAAGDNADGLAVLLALARYFMDPENKPVRTLVFVVSAGHHSPGLNGPSNFVRMNPEIVARTDMVVNLEHVAQLEFDPAAARFNPQEQRMSFGISNASPYLSDVARRGLRRYGFRINPEFTTNVPGDLGGYASTGAVRVQAIHSGPFYHTSGDVLETISRPGLERAARFFAYFVRESARAPMGWLDPS